MTSQSTETDAIKFCVHPVRYVPWGWILHFDGGKPFSQCVCLRCRDQEAAWYVLLRFALFAYFLLSALSVCWSELAVDVTGGLTSLFMWSPYKHTVPGRLAQTRIYSQTDSTNSKQAEARKCWGSGRNSEIYRSVVLSFHPSIHRSIYCSVVPSIYPSIHPSGFKMDKKPICRKCSLICANAVDMIVK